MTESKTLGNEKSRTESNIRRLLISIFLKPNNIWLTDLHKIDEWKPPSLAQNVPTSLTQQVIPQNVSGRCFVWSNYKTFSKCKLGLKRYSLPTLEPWQFLTRHKTSLYKSLPVIWCRWWWWWEWWWPFVVGTSLKTDCITIFKWIQK